MQLEGRRAAYGSPEYAAAKAALIRLTTALSDWDERFGIRVSCVVPDWIGLLRAHAEVGSISSPTRAPRPRGRDRRADHASVQ